MRTANCRCLMRSITRPGGRLISSFANLALMHVKHSRDENLLIFMKPEFLLLLWKMSLFRNWNGQKWGNRLDRLRMSLPCSRNSMQLLIIRTSKNGYQNSASILSGSVPANSPASNKNPATRYTYRFIHPSRRDPMASSAVSYAREHQQKFLGELKDLLRIPSVSTAPEHKEDVRRAAMFVADEMRRIGLENVDVIPTRNHPLVYGDWLHAPGKPTVLCYAHYDVQPPDPLNEWLTPPFEPTERNQNIYARGAVDDKGQLWMEIKAVEALMRANNGKLPINVKFIIEGEEEVGGESIAAYVRAQKP